VADRRKWPSVVSPIGDVPDPEPALAIDSGRFVEHVLDNPRKAGVRNTVNNERLESDRLVHQRRRHGCHPPHPITGARPVGSLGVHRGESSLEVGKRIRAIVLALTVLMGTASACSKEAQVDSGIRGTLFAVNIFGAVRGPLPNGPPWGQFDPSPSSGTIIVSNGQNEQRGFIDVPDDGRFLIRLPPGPYIVRADAPSREGAAVRRWVRRLDVEPHSFTPITPLVAFEFP
jgi:hypothetical protein